MLKGQRGKWTKGRRKRGRISTTKNHDYNMDDDNDDDGDDGGTDDDDDVDGNDDDDET